MTAEIAGCTCPFLWLQNNIFLPKSPIISHDPEFHTDKLSKYLQYRKKAAIGDLCNFVMLAPPVGRLLNQLAEDLQAFADLPD